MLIKRIAATGALVAVLGGSAVAAAPAGALIGCYGNHGRRVVCKPVTPLPTVSLVAKRGVKGLTGLTVGYGR
jgi:hypothetical protein